MALDPVTNFGIVTVSTGYDASATSIVLTSGHGAKLPSTFSYNLVWWNSTDYGSPADDPNVEIVRVTGRSTDTLTVTRAQEGTAAAAHNTAGKEYRLMNGITKAVMDAIQTDISTKFPTSGGTLTGAVVPTDHGTATNPEVVAVVYGTGNPPTASTTPIGTLFIKYTE